MVSQPQGCMFSRFTTMKLQIQATAQNAQVQEAIEAAFTKAGFQFSARGARGLLDSSMCVSEDGLLVTNIIVTPKRLVHNGEKWQFATSTVISFYGESVEELLLQIGTLQPDATALGLEAPQV